MELFDPQNKEELVRWATNYYSERDMGDYGNMTPENQRTTLDELSKIHKIKQPEDLDSARKALKDKFYKMSLQVLADIRYRKMSDGERTKFIGSLVGGIAFGYFRNYEDMKPEERIATIRTFSERYEIEPCKCLCGSDAMESVKNALKAKLAELESLNKGDFYKELMRIHHEFTRSKPPCKTAKPNGVEKRVRGTDIQQPRLL